MKSFKILICLFTITALCFVPIGTATADDGPGAGFGARTGLGLEPDQFLIGPQAVFGNFAGFIRFAPSLDFGFGDNVTTFTLDADVRLNLLPLPGSDANLYFDVGPSIVHFSPDAGDGDTEVGLNLTGGLVLPMGSSNSYNVEASIGVGDVTDIRLLIGVYIGRGAGEPETVEETDVDVDVEVDGDSDGEGEG